VTIPTAAAIANAVSNAIAKRVKRLPISPSQVLGLLGKVPGVPVGERNGETGT
jgi:CO/xanthine dehydrogenase Mo-binding subunit